MMRIIIIIIFFAFFKVDCLCYTLWHEEAKPKKHTWSEGMSVYLLVRTNCEHADTA